MTLEEQVRAIVREELDAREAPPVDYTLRQFGELLGRHEETIRQWCVQDRVPGAYQLMDREWRIPRDSLVALQEQERERWASRQKQYAASGQR